MLKQTSSQLGEVDLNENYVSDESSIHAPISLPFLDEEGRFKESPAYLVPSIVSQKDIENLCHKAKRYLFREMSDQEEWKLLLYLQSLPKEHIFRRGFNFIYDTTLKINKLRGFEGGSHKYTKEGYAKDLTKEEWKYSAKVAIRIFDDLHNNGVHISNNGKRYRNELEERLLQPHLQCISQE